MQWITKKNESQKDNYYSFRPDNDPRFRKNNNLTDQINSGVHDNIKNLKREIDVRIEKKLNSKENKSKNNLQIPCIKKTINFKMLFSQSLSIS